jgi:hypothetical protein
VTPVTSAKWPKADSAALSLGVQYGLKRDCVNAPAIQRIAGDALVATKAFCFVESQVGISDERRVIERRSCFGGNSRADRHVFAAGRGVGDSQGTNGQPEPFGDFQRILLRDIGEDNGKLFPTVSSVANEVEQVGQR